MAGDPINRFIRRRSYRLDGGGWRILFYVLVKADPYYARMIRLGGFDAIGQARQARAELFAELGLDVDAPPRAIQAAARAWLKRRQDVIRSTAKATTKTPRARAPAAPTMAIS